MLGIYGYAVLIAWAIAMVFTVDQGPASAPITLYLLLIPASAVVRPTPPMIWFATAAAGLSYGWLLVFAGIWRPDLQVPALKAISFLVSLATMGFITHVLIRACASSPPDRPARPARLPRLPGKASHEFCQRDLRNTEVTMLELREPRKVLSPGCIGEKSCSTLPGVP